MEIQVPDAVRQFSERYTNDVNSRDLNNALRAVRGGRDHLLLLIFAGIPFAGFCVTGYVIEADQGDKSTLLIVSIAVIMFLLWQIPKNFLSYKREKQRRNLCQLDKREGVVEARQNDGLYYLAYQMIMRVNVAREVRRHMTTIHRAQMAGVRVQPGDTSKSMMSRRDHMRLFFEKGERLVLSIQNELDAVGGAIEYHRRRSDHRHPTLRAILVDIMTGGVSDKFLHRRLQAIAYEPSGLVVDQFERIARWKHDGDISVGELEKLFDELLFTEYMDKWNADLPEWSPELVQATATE